VTFGARESKLSPRTNDEVIREGYAHFNRGDLDWVVAHLDPEITWEDAEDVPDTRIYEGIGQVRHFLESFARHWEEIRFEPQEVLETDDVVLANCRLIGRGRASGAEVDAEVIHVWNMRRHKVLRVRTFFDRGEAAAAAGIERPGSERRGDTGLR
jgi:ketosteroid isomerase-like protein